MVRNTFEDHKAVADILCSGGVLVKRLGEILASSTAVQLGKSLQVHSSPTRRRRLVLRLLFHRVVITNLSV